MKRSTGIWGLSALLLSFSAWTYAGDAAKPAAAGAEDSINPMARVVKASEMPSWLNRDNLKKNQNIELMGEVQPATGKDKGAVCVMKIYIQPPVPPPVIPPKGTKAPTTPPPPPVLKAKTHSFPVYSDDKAIAAYLKVLFSANLVPTVTFQGQFEDTDETHKSVEDWKRFKAIKLVSTSASLAQAREVVLEREKKAAEIKKQIADDMKGPVAGLERNNPPPKKPETKKPEDKKLVDEEK